MKVMHVTTVHPCMDNRIYKKMVLSLVESGSEVWYLAQRDSQSQNIDQRVRFLGLPSVRGFLGKVIRILVAVYLIMKFGRKPKAIIHFHDPEFIFAGIFLRILGWRVIYDIHEDNLLGIRQKYYLPKWIRGPLAMMVASIESISARCLELVIAERCYAKRFPRAAPILNYPRQSDFPQGSGTQNVAADSFKLLYTGVISEDRGALNHVDILKCQKNIELHMVGSCSDDLREKLILRAGDCKGRLFLETHSRHLPFGKILDKYASESWLCGLAIFPETPHYYEKELTKFFEYMAFGLPIVCSDFPVWRQLVGSVGMVVQPGNVTQIADAIGRLRTDKQFREHCSMEGRRMVREKYDWDSEFGKLERFYRREHSNG